MKTCVLFDLDGTLLDTLQDLTDCVNHALAQFSYPPRTPAEIRSFLGVGAKQLIIRSLPEGVAYEPVLECYTAWYKDHCEEKTVPYPGIPEALEAIAAKYPVGIVSNKPDHAVKQMAKVYFGDIYALGERPEVPHKPEPDMLLRAMADLGADRCVYVGDSDVDVLTAKNAGCPCISVTWGFRDVDELLAAGADHLCNAAAELLPILSELEA